MSDDATIAVYDAQADEYRRKTEKLYELKEAEAFAEALPAGGHVLDLGCGPGLYAAWFAARGFAVAAWDASAEMVRLARAQGVAARQAAFDELETEGVYHGVWANFSLLHAPRADLPGLLARIRRAGRPGMALHLGMKLGSGEGPDRLGRFYAYYREDELEGLLRDAGFRVAQRWHGQGPGLDGTMSDYVTLLCHG